MIEENVSKAMKESIKNSASETLAVHAAIYRALKFRKKIATLCMQELSQRRKNGEKFDYESYIDEKVKTIPQMKGTNLVSAGQSFALANKSFLGENK